MSLKASYSINVGGELLSLDTPIVMGILNATPDSFYQHHEGGEAIRLRTRQILAEGATILDVGACSTRPGYTPPDEKEEMRRLREALTIVRKEAPKAIVSVDTFRANVAKMSVEEYGVQIVNDISGGTLDAEMFRTVAKLGVPYVLTESSPFKEEDKKSPFEGDIEGQLLRNMGSKVEALHDLGVCDIILDPGFGFGKTLEQNYILMQNLEVLHELELPLLVGVSHKSMIYKLLGTTPDGALNGTTVLHTIALMKGAHILRAHEVKEVMECIRIVRELNRKW
ncbi:MAG: dihydropteroate synthase [Bacteroidaceae bacterium]|nr:dihydropteroate synthase [Bacteroidaceae bacterium]